MLSRFQTSFRIWPTVLLRFSFTLINERNFATVAAKFTDSKSISEVSEYIRIENTYPLISLFTQEEFKVGLPLQGLTQLESLLQQKLPVTSDQLVEACFCKFELLIGENRVDEAKNQSQKIKKMGTQFKLDISDMNLDMEIRLRLKSKEQDPSKEVVSQLRELCDTVNVDECNKIFKTEDLDESAYLRAIRKLRIFSLGNLELGHMHFEAKQYDKCLECLSKSIQGCNKLPEEILRNFEVFYLALLSYYRCLVITGPKKNIFEVCFQSYHIFSSWPEAKSFDQQYSNASLKILFLNGMMIFAAEKTQQKEYAAKLVSSLKQYQHYYGQQQFDELKECDIIDMEELQRLTKAD